MGIICVPSPPKWVEIGDVEWLRKLQRGQDLGLRRLAIGARVIDARHHEDEHHLRDGQCNEREDHKKEAPATRRR
jgi:hypothetical protein